MNIDFGRGIKRIFIVLASIYTILIFLFSKIIDTDTKIETKFINSIDCNKTKELFFERNSQKEEGGKSELLNDSLSELDKFIEIYGSLEFGLIDKSDGCYASFKRPLSERIKTMAQFTFWFGIVPSAIIYALLAFIINGFRKK